MLTDTTIVMRHGPREIIKQRAEVLWNDGSRVWLHRLQLHGLPSLFERAIDTGDGRFRIVDITELVPSLDIELRRSHERDVTGLVFYTLRAKFKGAADFMAAAAHFGQLTDNMPLPMVTRLPSGLYVEVGELERMSAADVAGVRRYLKNRALTAGART